MADMSEEFVGGTDQGTGVVTETIEVQGDISTEVQGVQQIDNQAAPTISVAEAMKLKEENQRLKDYNEFIRQTGAEQAAPQKPKFEMPPDAIPYVEDVDKLVDAKLYAFQAQRDAEQLDRDLRNLAEDIKSKDNMFEKRMELAIEYMDRDQFSQAQFDRARTAQDKIAVLEKIAKWHPMYDSISKPVPQATDAIQRLQANAKIPPTLATMQGAGKTMKSVSDMNEQEYAELFKQVTKGY